MVPWRVFSVRCHVLRLSMNSGNKVAEEKFFSWSLFTKQLCICRWLYKASKYPPLFLLIFSKIGFKHGLLLHVLHNVIIQECISSQVIQLKISTQLCLLVNKGVSFLTKRTVQLLLSCTKALLSHPRQPPCFSRYKATSPSNLQRSFLPHRFPMLVAQ